MAIPQIPQVKPAVLPQGKPMQSSNPIKPMAPATKPAFGASPLTKPPQDQARQAYSSPTQVGQQQFGGQPIGQGQQMAGSTSTTYGNQSSQTPAGLQGNINPQRYNNPYANQEGDTGGINSGAGGYGGGWIGDSAAVNRAENFTNGVLTGPQSGGSGNPAGSVQSGGLYDAATATALEQAMRGLNPRIDSQNAAFEQMMVGRGLDPRSEQYISQRGALDRRNNDLLSQAEYGAQQQGMAAQQQGWNQDYQYDALQNALNQASIGANASMSNARTGAAASRYGADASMQNAQLANALGYSRLNEQGRQFDVNDIFRTQGQDINAALGFGQLGLGQQDRDLNVFNANRGAQTDWWNQIGGMTNNAPGVNFQPTGNVAGQMQQAGQNAYNAQNAQNSALGGLLGAGLSMWQPSDERLKENIMYVDTISGVNVYEFDYIDKTLGADRYRGVMAQEVKESHPEAIAELGGFMMVDYSKLPVDMETI